ncbi:lysostaphin resistance A-like protein, partial [Clostridium tarantellae]|uniref:CPBP family intramembrane glutamic endopeptidase n=1 Tax=Clostridium tarantellae TaxID=39493 RepID=UPI003BEECAD6
MFCLFHLIILAPFVEEILFRGIIFKRLRQSINIYIAIIIQAILFALLHPGLLHSILTMIFGILLAFIYDKFKNIIMPIMLH